MECLRKGEEKSENRRSIIVEAGALAVAANVEHLSLTSKNNIASIEQVRCEEFPSSKITNMTSPVYIQDKWNRSFVLMILLATSGFLVWNGVKWTAKTRKDDKDGQATDSPNPVEKRLHDEFMTGLEELELKVGDDFKEYRETFSKWYEQFKEDLSGDLSTSNMKKMATLQKCINDMLNSFKDTRKGMEKDESSLQPWFFVWSLEAIDEVVKLVKEVDVALSSHNKDVKAITDAINEYQQEFLNESSNFLSDCPALKNRYDSLRKSLSGKYLQLETPQLKQENQ